MRQALNENPKVQLAVIGGLLLIAGAFFMLRGAGGAEEEGAAPVTPAPATGAATVGGPPPAGAVAAPAATAAAPVGAAPAPTAGTVSPEALIPGPGLPAPVADAWKRGDAIVVLIVRNGGVDDRLVREATSRLEARAGVEVFSAKAKDVARYSRITQGVGVSRVPALVVVRPRSVSGEVPQATVSYGFRNADSAAQAVRDALYGGKDNLPYHPG